MDTQSEIDWLNINLPRLGVAADDQMWIGIENRTEEGQWRLVVDGTVVDTGLNLIPFAMCSIFVICLSFRNYINLPLWQLHSTQVQNHIYDFY